MIRPSIDLSHFFAVLNMETSVTLTRLEGGIGRQKQHYALTMCEKDSSLGNDVSPYLSFLYEICTSNGWNTRKMVTLLREL